MLNQYFYSLLHKYFSLYIMPGDKIVEIDPKKPDLINQFRNDIKKSIVYINESAKNFGCQILGSLQEVRAFKADYLINNGNLHYVRDIQSYLEKMREDACDQDTRVIFTYYSSAWRPFMRVATALKLRIKDPEQNWISHEDIDNLLYLSGYEMVKRDHKVLLPIYIPFFSNFANNYLAALPFFRIFTMVNIVIARPLITTSNHKLLHPSVSVVIPARNEAGNIEKAMLRLPKMGPDDEVIFVEGNSTDDTWDKIAEVEQKYGNKWNIKIAKQEGKGKGDAVRKGFSLATKDILMILDADLTVPPEDLPKFYRAIITNKGEFVNGSRLVYPMEKEAMRFFNILGNKFFATAFSFVLGQRFKDTLCGTKVLSRRHYIKIAQHRSYFGDFDPFGDFDLIFGASRLGLKIVEIPVGYKERTYGTTNIQRWKHGVILLQMLIFAARKIKFI